MEIKGSSIPVFASCMAGLMIAGCHRTMSHTTGSHTDAAVGGMRAVSSLICPDAVGNLKRINEASDERSCQYRGERAGEEVALTLIALNGGSPATALAPLEASLKADAGPHAFSASAGEQAGVRPGSNGDQANIDMPGLHIHAGGDHAQLRIAGVNIDADGDTAHIQTAGGNHATVDARPGGAEVRAGNTGPEGADFTLILASDAPGPHGYKAVGYIARGPSGGPLVVAAFRSKAGRYDGENTDLKRLVDLNVRG